MKLVEGHEETQECKWLFIQNALRLLFGLANYYNCFI